MPVKKLEGSWSQGQKFTICHYPELNHSNSTFHSLLFLDCLSISTLASYRLLPFWYAEQKSYIHLSSTIITYVVIWCIKSFELYNLLHFLEISSLFVPNVICKAIISNTINFVKDHCWYPYKTTGKIIVFINFNFEWFRQELWRWKLLNWVPYHKFEQIEDGSCRQFQIFRINFSQFIRILFFFSYV